MRGFFSFPFPTPSLSHDSLSPCYQFLSLCALIMSPVCLCGSGLLTIAAARSDVPIYRVSSVSLLTSTSPLQDPTAVGTNYIPSHGSHLIICLIVLFLSCSAAVVASYLLSERVAFLIFSFLLPPSHWLSPLFSLRRMLFCYFLYKKSCTGGPECTAQHKDFKWGE